MSELYPVFKDKYGHVLEYQNPDGDVDCYYGIYWVQKRQTGKVYMVISNRPYATTGPARAWVTRMKERHKGDVTYKWLDGNIIISTGWKTFD